MKLFALGKLVILPVDQGFEHGPSKSFVPNPDAFDPDYHFNFAIEAGCNAYAAPLGFIEHGAKKYSNFLKPTHKVISLKAKIFKFPNRIRKNERTIWSA